MLSCFLNCSVLLSQQQLEEFQFSSSSTFIMVYLSNFRHSNTWVVLSHCNYNLHFPND